MMTNLDRIKKGQENKDISRDYFILERISKLLVSASEVIDRYLTKEIFLKLVRPMFASNIIILKSQTGSRFGLSVQNERLKSLLLKSESKPQKGTSYKDLLLETNLISI